MASFDGGPTSTLTLSSLDFTALTGGRDDSTTYIEDGRVVLDGDLEVARRIAENLAYTI